MLCSGGHVRLGLLHYREHRVARPQHRALPAAHRLPLERQRRQPCAWQQQVEQRAGGPRAPRVRGPRSHLRRFAPPSATVRFTRVVDATRRPSSGRDSDGTQALRRRVRANSLLYRIIGRREQLGLVRSIRMTE